MQNGTCQKNINAKWYRKNNIYIYIQKINIHAKWYRKNKNKCEMVHAKTQIKNGT